MKVSALRFYVVQSEWPESEEELAGILEAAEFQPCGTFTKQSAGFEPPVEKTESFARRLAGADLMQLRIQKRVLPAAAIKEALAERVDIFEERTGRPPSRKEKKELKDEVEADLLPKALLASERLRAFYIRELNILAVGTASATQAELLFGKLRECMGTAQYVPLETKEPASPFFISQLELAGPFSLGSECQLEDIAFESRVRYIDFDLTDPSIANHISEGMEVTHLAIGDQGVYRCVLGADLVAKKWNVDLFDETADEEDPIARHDADFTLLCDATTRLLKTLIKKLGGLGEYALQAKKPKGGKDVSTNTESG